MLIIDNAQVAQLLTMADCIRAQEEAFAQLGTGVESTSSLNLRSRSRQTSSPP